MDTTGLSESEKKVCATALRDASAYTIATTPVPRFALDLLDILQAAGWEAWIVGGFVRDALRGVVPHDVDIATGAPWKTTRDLCLAHGYRVVLTGVAHGTITVVHDDQTIEITTFRTESTYSDHRHPDAIQFVDTIEEDLARRDFTMNAIAWNPMQGFCDPFHGQEDIAHALIRAVGDPARRFSEDGLRILRGLRFAATLSYQIEPITAHALHDYAGQLHFVSPERISAEFDRLILGADAARILREYVDIAVLVIPEIASMVGFDQGVAWHCYDVWEHCLHTLDRLPAKASRELRYAAFLHDIGKPAMLRIGTDGHPHFYGHEKEGARLVRQIGSDLRWRTADTAWIASLVRFHDRRIPPTTRGVQRILAHFSCMKDVRPDDVPRFFRDLLDLKRADAAAHAPGSVKHRTQELRQLESAFNAIMTLHLPYRIQDLQVNGTDILACGIEPGPQVGSILHRLLDEVIVNDLPNDRTILLQRVSQIHQEMSGKNQKSAE